MTARPPSMSRASAIRWECTVSVPRFRLIPMGGFGSVSIVMTHVHPPATRSGLRVSSQIQKRRTLRTGDRHGILGTVFCPLLGLRPLARSQTRSMLLCISPSIDTLNVLRFMILAALPLHAVAAQTAVQLAPKLGFFFPGTSIMAISVEGSFFQATEHSGPMAGLAVIFQPSRRWSIE